MPTPTGRGNLSLTTSLVKQTDKRATTTKGGFVMTGTTKCSERRVASARKHSNRSTGVGRSNIRRKKVSQARTNRFTFVGGGDVIEPRKETEGERRERMAKKVATFFNETAARVRREEVRNRRVAKKKLASKQLRTRKRCTKRTPPRAITKRAIRSA